MNVNEKILKFVHHYGNPFFVGSTVDNKLFYINQKAEELFQVTVETCNFETIFQVSIQRMKSLVDKAIKTDSHTLVNHHIATTGAGEEILVDLLFGYFDEEKTEIFLEIIPQQDTRMDIAVHQVSHSTRPEAILNFDETLSIIYCNDQFHEVFDSSEEIKHSHFENHLVNGFLPEVRDSMIAEIQEALTIGRQFSKKIKVFTAKGDERWYLMELEKRCLDSSGEDKILIFMSNIEKQVEMEEEFSLLKKHLSLLQELTINILYRVDVKTKVFSHTYKPLADKIGDDIHDYANVFIKNKVIHPEDSEKYLSYLQDFYGEPEHYGECIVRVALDSDEYLWYKVRGRKIFNEAGEFVEVMGAMQNIDEEHKLREQNQHTMKFFHALERISPLSFYSIDVKNKILRQQGDVQKDLTTGNEIHDFPESLFYNVHPNDLELYKKYVYACLAGNCGTAEFRLLGIDGSFQWHETSCEAIYDNEGALSELIGIITNIHSKKATETSHSNTSQYLTALQSMTAESFYTVDVKNKIFRQQGEVAEKLALAPEYFNFPESFEYKIFPDEVEQYRTFIQNAMAGIAGNVQVRVKTIQGVYEWYEIFAEIIRDNTGEVTEFIGKMSNIQKTITLEEENTAYSDYMDVMKSLSGESIYNYDIKNKILRNNGILCTELGLASTITNYPDSTKRRMESNDTHRFIDFFNTSMKNSLATIEIQLKTIDGSYQWYELVSVLVCDKEGNPSQIFGRVRNIEGEKNISTQYSLLSQYFRSMNHLTEEVLCHIDIKTMTYRHSLKTSLEVEVPFEIPNFVEYFLENKLIHPEDEEHFRDSVAKIVTGEIDSYEVRSLVAEGVYESFMVKSSLIFDEEGQPVEVFSAMKNVQKEIDLNEKASLDLLTNVLNKISFEQQVGNLLMDETKGVHHALVIIDMDDFKEVNDKYGHQFGDFVLTNFAQRIKNCIRDTDVIGRIGGDEFMVFLRGVFNQDMALKRVETMFDRLKPPFANGTHSHKLGASIGISIIPEDGISYDVLYKNADLAVYESKKRGKNVATLYSSDLDKT